MVFGLRLGLPKKASAVAPITASAAADAASAPTLSPNAAKKGAAQGGSPSPSGKRGDRTPLTVNEFVSRSKKCREKGLEPTKPELIAYARYLGIDPVLDADLLWIADEALTAPLPAEWTEHHDSAERIFYYNTQTHASSWTHPLEQLHRDTYKSIVDFRNGNKSKEDQVAQVETLRKRCEAAEHEAHKELQVWSEHIDDQGQKFYYNKDEQRSVWTDPRPSRCHALYLEMKALRCLGGHIGNASLAQMSPKMGHMPFGGAKEERSAPGRDSVASKVERDRSRDRAYPANSDVEMAPSGMLNSRGFSKKNDALASSNGMQKAEGDPLLKMKPSFLAQPSALSKVEEARAALSMGMGPSLRPIRGDPLFGDNNRSASMDALFDVGADGLSSVGRTKVRAGIRLEPLKLN